MRQVVVYALGTVACVLAAVFIYPFFFSQSYRGFEDQAPTVVVFIQGSLGKSIPVVEISAPRTADHAILTVSQDDVTQKTSAKATIYVGVETWVKGFKFAYSPLDCTSKTGHPMTDVVNPDDPIDLAVAKKLMSKPATTGKITSITFVDPVVAPSITCGLDSFGFGKESIAVSSVYVPGIETYALDGTAQIVTTYSVGRDPSEYIERASQQPSEVLATVFTWYQRDFELLARQGLFVSVSSPQAQQESAYRLFIAGALVGLGGGLAVAAIQVALGLRSSSATVTK